MSFDVSIINMLSFDNIPVADHSEGQKDWRLRISTSRDLTEGLTAWGQSADHQPQLRSHCIDRSECKEGQVCKRSPMFWPVTANLRVWMTVSLDCSAVSVVSMLHCSHSVRWLRKEGWPCIFGACNAQKREWNLSRQKWKLEKFLQFILFYFSEVLSICTWSHKPRKHPYPSGRQMLVKEAHSQPKCEMT